MKHQVTRGAIVGGRYRVEEFLDHGGMAVVYKAQNTGTGRPCALKLVHPHMLKRREIVDLFIKEARVGSKIGDHPNIVTVYDAGVDQPTGRPFIAMEFLEGRTLESHLDDGPLTKEEARLLFAQLGSALEQAHAAGIVHRDLKPSNLFVTRSRADELNLKILDFGIAKALEGEAQGTATQIGTPAYAAPEQLGPTARRLAAEKGITITKAISPSTDVWALGLIALETLTGIGPESYWQVETSAELPMRVALESSRPASACIGSDLVLPAGFDEWFLRCLRRNANERWPSISEAITTLLVLLGPTDDEESPRGVPNDSRGSAETEVVQESVVRARHLSSASPVRSGQRHRPERQERSMVVGVGIAATFVLCSGVATVLLLPDAALLHPIFEFVEAVDMPSAAVSGSARPASADTSAMSPVDGTALAKAKTEAERNCWRKGEARGEAKVVLNLAGDGTASVASVSSNFRNTRIGTCIREVYASTTIAGGPTSIRDIVRIRTPIGNIRRPQGQHRLPVPAATAGEAKQPSSLCDSCAPNDESCQAYCGVFGDLPANDAARNDAPRSDTPGNDCPGGDWSNCL